MALFLAGPARSVDQRPDQGGADRRRLDATHLPAHRAAERSAPIFVAVLVGASAVRHQDLRPRARADRRRARHRHHVPAIYVYDLMFQRGQIAEVRAAAIMILLALAAILRPLYDLAQSARSPPRGGTWLTRVATTILSPPPERGGASAPKIVVYCPADRCSRLLSAAARRGDPELASATCQEISRNGLIGLPHSFSLDCLARRLEHVLRRRHLRRHRSSRSATRCMMVIPATIISTGHRRDQRLRAVEVALQAARSSCSALHDARRVHAGPDGAAPVGIHARQARA